MKLSINSKKVLLLFFFLYPISPWYITLGPLNLVNIISILFIGYWILSGNDSIAKFKGSSIFFWLYLMFYSIQAIFDTSISKAMAYIFSQLFICIIVYTEVKKRDILNEVLMAMIYACIFLCFTGIVEEITRTNIFHLISGLESSYFYTEIRLGIYRIETSFSHPIVYCAYLCFMAGIVVYMLDKETRKSKRNILKLAYILIWINAIFTMSRSTLFVLVLEQLILGYKTGVVKFTKRISFIICSVLMLLGVIFILDLQISDKIKDVWYMLLSVFNDKYSALYSTSFGINQNAVGNRLDLYSWVIDAVKGNELFGMGTSAEFAYQVNSIETTWYTNYTWTKTSIENEYLFNYFIHGFVGLISFVLLIVGSIRYSYKVKRARKIITDTNFYEEKNLKFSDVIFVLLIGYAVILFSVRSSDNVRTFNIIMCLLFGYYNNLKSKIKTGGNL